MYLLTMGTTYRHLFISVLYALSTLPHLLRCSQDLDTFRSSFHSSMIPSFSDIQLINREWEKGNADAGAQLSFAKVLGAGTDQNIGSAISLSNSLLSQGAARAYTTYAFLLNHNLTETYLPEVEREQKAMSNYVIAALNGDPVAQLIAGEMYYKRGDCQSAVSYYFKVSSFVIQNVLEMEVSQPTYVNYVREEDSTLPKNAFPSQDLVDYLEYMSDNENEAALQVASLFMSGTSSIKRDFSKAEQYLKKAVDGNSTMAMIWLAQLHLRSLIEEADEVKALRLLEKAIEYGNDLAHSGMGRIYMDGKAGVQKDFQKAEFHFKKGIEAGNIDAFYQMGRLYFLKEGPGTSSDAANIWILPATLGHVHAAWSLAEYYRTNYMEESYQTVFAKADTALAPKVCDIVYSHYHTVAQAGKYSDLFDEAFNDYENGRKDSALMKYLLLSDLGYNAGHINAARILDEGTTGIYDNEMSIRRKAFDIWSRAADNGETKGYVRLGDYIYYGMAEVEKNSTTAAVYYAKAYSLGDPEGGFSLALANEWGDGISQDLAEAEKIYTNLINKYADAAVPATIALYRLKSFAYLSELFDINAYDTFNRIYIKFSSTLEHFKINLIALWNYWDYLLMIILVIFILSNRILRR